MTWLILLAPLVLMGVLVALAMYLRGGPPTAHGYAIHTTPRRRREVSPWVIALLRPAFAYNQHRRAYVLRGIGNRLGPVLRRRREPEELLPEPRRTGRFQRAEPGPGEPGVGEPSEPITAAAGPRAPVGARERPRSKPPPGKRGKPEDAGRDR